MVDSEGFVFCDLLMPAGVVFPGSVRVLGLGLAWSLVAVHAMCLLVWHLLVTVMHSDSSWMAVWLLGWYQVVIYMRLAVMRNKAKRVDILILTF